MSSIGTGISEFVDLLEQGAIVTGSFDNIAHIFPDLIVKKGVKKAHLFVKHGLGWEQYDGNQSVTTEKIADEAIVFDKLSVDIQKVLSFAIQHFGLIIFKDKKIETICLTNWDTNGDGLLTKEEVSTVTNISEVFRGNTEIVSFDELSNFTNLTAIP